MKRNLLSKFNITYFKVTSIDDKNEGKGEVSTARFPLINDRDEAVECQSQGGQDIHNADDQKRGLLGI